VSVVGTEVRLGPSKRSGVKDSEWTRFQPMQSTCLYSPLFVNLNLGWLARVGIVVKSTCSRFHGHLEFPADLKGGKACGHWRERPWCGQRR
jgi:hypothetical protein